MTASLCFSAIIFASFKNGILVLSKQNMMLFVYSEISAFRFSLSSWKKTQC